MSSYRLGGDWLQRCQRLPVLKKLSLLYLKSWPAPYLVWSPCSSRRCQARQMYILGREMQPWVMHMGWWSSYKAESKVSEGNVQACLEEGLQGGREAWKDCLGDHSDSQERGVYWYRPPSSSSSLQLQVHEPHAPSPPFHSLSVSYLPDVLQKYSNKSLQM